MVIMERPTQDLPVEREIFQKQLDVAIAQFGLVYPCLLKDRTVDLYKLYCLVKEIKLKNNGDYSYTDNVEEWRRIAEEMGYMGDINAIVLFKIYNRYIGEGYEKSSSNLSGVPFTRTTPFKPHEYPRSASQARERAGTPGSDGEIPRQKRVYKKRKDKDRSVLNLPPSVAKSITPGRLNPSRYNITPIRYNIHANKSFSTCTRPSSPRVGGSQSARGGRGVSPARGSRGASPASSARGSTPPVVARTVDNIWDKAGQFRGVVTLNRTRTGHVTLLDVRDDIPAAVPCDKIPEGSVVEGTGADACVVDDGVLPKPTGEPEKYDVNPIIRQLECGLPHEVQFGLNMLLWLTKSWALPLPKYPKLLTALLANTGAIDEQAAKFWDDDGMCEFWAESQQESHFFNNGLKSQRTRAVQISVILGNLSHIESNVKYLLKSEPFLHYLVQSLKSSCRPIRNQGLEALSTLATQVMLEETTLYSQHVFKLLPTYLTSSDRFLIISGLEVITNLCRTSANHVYVVDNLTETQYELIVQLLLVPDVQLLHVVLESIYTLTSIGVHTCEQLLSRPHVFTVLVDLFSCTAERLEHSGVKVLRYVERNIVQKEYQELNTAEKEELRRVQPEKTMGTATVTERNSTVLQTKKSKYPTEMKGSVNFAQYWIKQNLQHSEGSILLKCAVYSKYLKAANAVTQPEYQTEVVSPAEFFLILSNIFPRSFRQKISVGTTMKFVVKNMDWLKGPAPASFRSDSPAYFMKIKSIAPKTATPRPNTPMTQFTTPTQPKPPAIISEPPSSTTKLKINPLPLSELADDPYKFVPDKTKEELEDEVKSDDEEEEDDDKKRNRFMKKSKLGEEGEPGEIFAQIIVEEMDVEEITEPQIIEECEDMDGRVVPENHDFPNSPEPTRVVKTYGVKRRIYTEPSYSRPSNNAFNRFTQQQPREYSQYKKTLKLDLSSTPEKKQTVEEENAARASSPSFNKPSSSPVFDAPNSPTFDRTFDKPVSPTFDNRASPTFDKPGSPSVEKASSHAFDRCASPVFNSFQPATKKNKADFDGAVSPTFDKPGSPTFDKPESPAFDKPGSPTFDKPGSPTFDKHGSPTFAKPVLSCANEVTEEPTSKQSDSKCSNSGNSIAKSKTSLEPMDHLNSISSSLLDDPTCTFSPLSNFESKFDSEPSIFDQNSENSTKQSNKMKVDNDIFVSESVPYSSEYSTVTYTSSQMSSRKYSQPTSSVRSEKQILTSPEKQKQPIVSPATAAENRKAVLKTVVSNHQTGDLVSTVSLIPISISGHIASRNVPQISSGVQTMSPLPQPPNSCQNTIRLAKISPQKSNVQYLSPNQQFQVLLPNQQHNLMVVNQQPGSGQQMYHIVPQSGVSQQRILMSPSNQGTGAQQVLVVPQNQNLSHQQIILAPQNQGPTQQVFVSQNQPIQSVAGQPVFITTSNHGSGQPIFIAQQNQAPSGGQQILLSPHTQNSTPQQILLAPQTSMSSTVTGQLILSPPNHQVSGPQPVFISPQPTSNRPVQFVQAPNSQVSGQIIIAPQGQVSSNQMMLSSAPNTRVLVLPQSQQPSNHQVLIAPQHPTSGQVQQIVIGTQTTPPVTSQPFISEPTSNQILLTSAPVFINSSAAPLVISSQISPTKQILVPLSSTSLAGGGRIAPASSGMTSLMTSCTTVYSDPVVCTAPANSRCTYTVSNTPATLPVISPIKMAHFSPIKIMTNGVGGAVALVQSNQKVPGSSGMVSSPQQASGGVKRSLTRIAPRPGPNTSTIPPVQTNTVEQRSPTAPVVEVERKRKLVLPPTRHTFPCYWKNCSGGFERENDLANHLLSKHASESPTACLWLTCAEAPGFRSKYSLLFHLKNIHARAPLLTHIPSCSYTQEKVRLFLSRARPWSDPRETPITRSLRLLVALTIRNLVYFTPGLVGDVSRYEEVFAMIAMSSQEAGTVLTDVLALTSGITQDSDDPVFITHLPPFR